MSCDTYSNGFVKSAQYLQAPNMQLLCREVTQQEQQIRNLMESDEIRSRSIQDIFTHLVSLQNAIAAAPVVDVQKLLTLEQTVLVLQQKSDSLEACIQSLSGKLEAQALKIDTLEAVVAAQASHIVDLQTIVHQLQHHKQHDDHDDKHHKDNDHDDDDKHKHKHHHKPDTQEQQDKAEPDPSVLLKRFDKLEERVESLDALFDDKFKDLVTIRPMVCMIGQMRRANVNWWVTVSQMPTIQSLLQLVHTWASQIMGQMQSTSCPSGNCLTGLCDSDWSPFYSTLRQWIPKTGIMIDASIVFWLRQWPGMTEPVLHTMMNMAKPFTNMIITTDFILAMLASLHWMLQTACSMKCLLA